MTSNKSWIREWVETIVVALVLALVIRTFILQVFFIPTGSMEPTLNVGDRIIVNKLVYRFAQPKRYDIAVFKYPYTKSGEKKIDYIKRVIGLPGETIELKDGVVFINNKQLNEKHLMNLTKTDFGPFKIPKDGYFMMGDNRPNSADSRVWGYLKKEYLVGPAVIRIWPLPRFGLLKD